MNLFCFVTKLKVFLDAYLEAYVKNLSYANIMHEFTESKRATIFALQGMSADRHRADVTEIQGFLGICNYVFKWIFPHNVGSS